MIRTIEPAVADTLRLLVPIDKAWQPTDHLPDLEAESWRNEVERFRAAAATNSDELLVVLLTLFAHHIRPMRRAVPLPPGHDSRQQPAVWQHTELWQALHAPPEPESASRRRRAPRQEVPTT